MIPILGLPVKIVKLFFSNDSPNEVSAGICLGMFMGFIPLNGPMAIALFVCFFLFKINRLAAMLVLPIFKLVYVLGVSSLADMLGGVLLINMEFLTGFWNWFTSLPVIAYLDINNTLVSGGLLISTVLSYPVFIGSKKGLQILREKYLDRMKEWAIVKWFKKLPLVGNIIKMVNGLRRGI